MRTINQAGLNLIKSFESLRLHPYADDAGVWTIGYGHTSGVTADTPAINAAQAEYFLKIDVSDAASSVQQKISISLNDNQFSALVSLVFNVGKAPLLHTLGAKLNAGDYAGASAEFLRWNRVGGQVSNGLTRRRNAEQRLFTMI